MAVVPIRKLLVANRGEIARRVIRSARALGIRTVAVFSDADADAPHVREADQAVRIGAPPPSSSYLDIDAILAAASRTGADALHPGYGFLAENAELAVRCGEAGVRFVGPSPSAIRLMGDKVQAKARMIDAGVPTAPGYWGEARDLSTLRAEGERLGAPLLVKAVAGGGGRGMRLVADLAELAGAIASAQAEAASAFGNPSVFLERLVQGARHVEIQIMADGHGTAIHLGERECSAQRRHQKIVEEAPSPVVDPDLRARMGDAAVAAARAIDYVGAGTVEFLLDDDGRFYFLEMNTRLQVEHPVTELVTGLDLVALQLRVAEGRPLGLAQSDVQMRGHAIEARVYAEDPYAGFLPQLGAVLLWRPAEGEGVRVDDGLRTGQEITPHYDAMVAKVIAWGEDREIARRRLVDAVRRSVLLGPGSNRAFLWHLLEDEAFVAGAIKTDTIDRRMAVDPPVRPEPSAAVWAMAAVLGSGVGAPGALASTPWRSTGDAGWPITLAVGDVRRELRVTYEGGSCRVGVGDTEIAVEILELGDATVRAAVDGVHETFTFARDDGCIALDHGGLAVSFVEPGPRSSAAEGAGDGRIRAPIGGRVLSVTADLGARVEAGATLVVIEAMKMEHRVLAKAPGIVAEVRVTAGDQVAARDLLVILGQVQET
jgi:geranyl-CoA carboxylase alpha subunit